MGGATHQKDQQSKQNQAPDLLLRGEIQNQIWNLGIGAAQQVQIPGLSRFIRPIHARTEGLDKTSY